MKKIKYILASGSPRRKELLGKLNIDFEILVSDVDETVNDSNPETIVETLANRKAKAVFDLIEEDNILVIGADTLVFYDGEPLGKPSDIQEATDMLSMLSGRTHQVLTGVSVIYRIAGKEETVTFHDTTDVTFYDIDRFDIAEYIKTGAPLDKAGAYGIQDDFAKHIKKINGDYNNVVGLPVSKLYQILKNIK